MGDKLRTCDLECKGKGIKDAAEAGRHEFVGPVKIVLVESTPADYTKKIWYSAVFTVAMLLMGATIFTMFFFTLNFKLPMKMNLHIVFCTMGFQFMTSGIMMFSSLFSGSNQLKPAHKKIHHFFLEICAVLFGFLGTCFALGYMSMTFHAISGLFGAVLSIVSCFIGPLSYTTDLDTFFGLFNKKSHINMTVPTFLMCTLCFILAFTKESFVKWMPCRHLNVILIIFTLIHTGTALLCVRVRLKNGL